MPASTKKDLYLASNLTELNKKTQAVEKVKDGQCRMYAKTCGKLFDNAKESELLGDEERAYVLYMKYLNIVTGIRKTAEYKKNKNFYDDMIGATKLVNAIEQAENLSGNLKNRYEEKEAREVSARLEKLDAEVEAKPLEKDDLNTDEGFENGGTADNNEEAAPNNVPEEKKGLLTCEKLYSLLTDGSSSLLIMDIRLEDQFQSSHIRDESCINIPRNIIAAGTTVHQIQPKISDEFKDGWNKRGTVDFIILLDWTCDERALQTGTALCSLKDAIYKWDQDTVVKSEPLLLEGGYEEWLNAYPTLTTNAAIARPPSYSDTSSAIISLDKIDYDMDLDFLKTPEEREAERQRAAAAAAAATAAAQARNTPQPAARNNIPMIDRKTKPGTGLNNSKPPSNINQPNRQPVERNIERINNDLNNTKTTNLADLRKILESSDENSVKSTKSDKDLNESKKAVFTKPPVPSVPDRTLKPMNKPSTESSGNPSNSSESSDKGITSSSNSVINSRNNSDTSLNETLTPENVTSRVSAPANATENVIVSKTSAQIEELKKLEDEKQRELQTIKQDNQRLALERQARKARLEAEQQQIDKIREVKSKEVEETAHLLRKKQQLKEELEQMEREKEERMAKEKQKQEELEQIRQREKEKQAEAARLREERKKKEETQRIEIERKKKEEAQRLEMKKIEEAERLERERKKKEEMERKKNEELARQEQMRLEEQKRIEAERKKKEESEREQQRRAAEASKGPQLPIGWERRYDSSASKYYYINHHTRQTQWEPPTIGGKVNSAPSAAAKKVQPESSGRYTTKLKDEEDVPSSGGLKRSHSSPNIAKLMQDEDKASQPAVSRQQKPLNSRPEIRDLRSQTDVIGAKVRNFTPIWGSVGHGLSGLRNQGNTCYMNSTIQCLSNTGFLTTYFLTGNYRHDINVYNKHGTKGEIAEEYAALVKAMWSGQYRSITPRDFKLSCARHCSTFAGYNQQDAQELLSYLLDWLHEDLNKIRQRPKLPEQQNDNISDEQAADTAWKMHKTVHDSVVVDLLQGQYKSTVMCKVCEKKSVTFDTFMYLSLEITSKSRCSLRDCLLNFSKEEKMTGDSKWNCPRCKLKRDAVKRIVIWKLPPILIIVLKRFYQDGMWRQKNSAYVDFPIDDVDFNKYISGPHVRKPYSLYGMSNHYGTMEGGHYTAFCKNPKLSRWFKFDDHEVYEYSKSDIKSSAAYFLFYTSVGQM